MAGSRAETRPDGKVGTQARLWPWSARAAVLFVPVILVVLILALATMRAVIKWPGEQYEGWILLMIALISVLPVILMVVQMLATSGGSIQLPGVSLSFAQMSQAAASVLRTTTLAENLGAPVEVPMAQSSLRSILGALRKAHDSEVTVVDLRQGRTWWETRLFILIAGAARRDRPQAIVFLGDQNGNSGAFLGWAPPSRLLAMHMTAMRPLAEAYDRALAMAAQWQIGMPSPGHPGGPATVTMPWNNSQVFLPSTADDVADPAFAMELYLQQELDVGPQSEVLRQYVTPRRLLDLYEAVLVTDRVDVDADDRVWAEMLAQSPKRYFAVTAAGKFKSLVPRDALVGALVGRLVAASQPPPTPQSAWHDASRS